MDHFQDIPEDNTWIGLNYLLHIFENYGWYLLGFSVISAIIYNKFLSAYVQKFKEYRFEKEYAAKYHKNPDVFAAHASAQQRWVEKMQEKYKKEAEEHERKMKEKEEKKRQELLAKANAEGGYMLGRKDDTSGLRQDYNPLMNTGHSSSYRPPRRSACGGGGCGR